MARAALAAREIDDLLDTLEALNEEMNGRHLAAPVDTTDVENWTELLDVPSQRDDRSSEKGDEPPGNDRIQQQVVQVVSTLAERLCELIAQHPRALDMIEWRHLEYVLAAALSEIGFEVELTPPAKDGGKDIVAECTVRGQHMTYYVEIKHWRSGKRVGSDDIYDFIEVNLQDRTDGGLFLSSSGFTEHVYSQLVEINSQQLRLGQKEKIVLLCQRFHRKRRGLWTPVDPLPKILFEATV